MREASGVPMLPDGLPCDNRDMRRPASHEKRRHWTPRAAIAGATVALSLGLGACQTVSGPLVDPGMVGMGCEQAQAFAFSGETSLAAIGLEEFVGGPDAQRIGMVWVTADAVNMNGPGPMPAGMEPMFDRMVCVQWPDGSGMSTSVPPGWEPPGDATAALTEEAAGPPLTLIGLIVAAALILGVSYIAFREERR